MAGTIAIVMALTACAPPRGIVGPESTPASPTAPVDLPSEPVPDEVGECRYLTDRLAAEANGERVARVEVSARQAPAESCFFYGYDDALHLAVIVYRVDAAITGDMVAQAVAGPADEGPFPVTFGADWAGRAAVLASGAVYVLARSEVGKGARSVVVVVRTRQKQSVKARTVARVVVDELGR
ncbi:DUF2020 domain-containing protein [Nocardia sp. IBHARD005]|uniref:DUF2020 domain-containing protein n=1 Tax=Nocardia sp. IBHARD005 TaxID=3457765 RepID=UPI004059AA51